jgi:maltose O-acetyltransferase
MRTERVTILAAQLYDLMSPGRVAARERARDLCQALNAAREADQDSVGGS